MLSLQEGCLTNVRNIVGWSGNKSLRTVTATASLFEFATLFDTEADVSE
jgi:hypothetical protein